MGRRFAIGIAVGLLLTVSVAPAASALGYNDDPFKGRVGEFAGPAYPEVVCRYDAAGRLNSMTVRPLTLYGSHDEPTYVGWQFQIREATPFHAGRLVYNSPIARQLASKTEPSSFANRRHTVRENLVGTRAYYVLPVMKFFAPGSRTTVEGKAVLIYDGYLQKMGGQSFWSNACTFDFGLIFQGD